VKKNSANRSIKCIFKKLLKIILKIPAFLYRPNKGLPVIALLPMNKLCLLPISLILLNLSFAADTETHRGSDCIEEVRNEITLTNAEKQKKEARKKVQKEAIANAQNAPTAGAAVGKNPQLLQEHVVIIPPKVQPEETNASGTSKGTSSKAQTAQVRDKKKSLQRGKRSDSGKAKQFPRKRRNFSRRTVVPNQKKSQNLNKGKQLTEKTGPNASLSKSSPTPKKKLISKAAPKKSLPKDGQFAEKKDSGAPQSKDIQSLPEAKQISGTKKMPSFPIEDSNIRQEEQPIEKTSPIPPELEESEKTAEATKPPQSSKIRDQKKQQSSGSKLPEATVQAPETPADKTEASTAELDRSPLEETAEVAPLSTKIPKVKERAKQRKEKAQKAPYERRGTYLIPFASRNQSKTPKIHSESKRITQMNSKQDRPDSQNQTDSLDQAEQRNKRGSNPTQKQSNGKEKSSTYDRYISRQNHHSLSQNTSQNSASSTGQNRAANRKGQARARSRAADQTHTGPQSAQ
jgi:hypothetical protein